jgi:hypothetical protein
LIEPQNVVVLKSQGRHYIVVAPVVKVAETEMEIFDSPFQ